MEVTDIVKLGGGSIQASGIFARDCAWPITRILKRMPRDEVLMNMPVSLGWWEDDTVVPVLLDQTIDADTTDAADACKAATISASLTEGGLIAPNQTQIKANTPVLQIEKLIPAYCKMRNIARNELGLSLNKDGTIDKGSPYAVDFARFALAAVSQWMAGIVSDRIMRGDESDPYGLDGLYTQLLNGWEQGTTPIPQYLNQCVQIDWADLTGTSPLASPDDVTVAGKTVSLWGEIVDVPENLNLPQFLEELYIPALEAQWTEFEGGVDVYEMHVKTGTKRCMINAASCLQPCGVDSNLIGDPTLRERFARLRRQDIVQFYPSGREVPMWESPRVESGVMWFGPRSIGGNPTYSTLFRDITEMFTGVGTLNNTYGHGAGEFQRDEPLLAEYLDTIPFEAAAVHYDVTKISHDCVQAGELLKVGVLAVARHMWLRIENLACATFIADVNSGILIDGVPLEGTPAQGSVVTPTASQDMADTTPDLVAGVVAGATSYDFQIASDPAFVHVVETTNNSDETYTVTVPLVADAVYYLRVRARNAKGPGNWSPIRKFTA